MRTPKIKERKEDRLRDYLYERGVLAVRVPQRRREESRFRLLQKEAKPRIFGALAAYASIFGLRTVGYFRRPASFDLVARPIPRRSELVIVELKSVNLAFDDIRQLLSYINLVRLLQCYGGKTGLRILTDAVGLRVTRRTKVSGLLIGKSVKRELMGWLPDEIWSLIRVCTFRVCKGKRPDDLQDIRIYDSGEKFRRRRRTEVKKAYNKLNPRL